MDEEKAFDRPFAEILAAVGREIDARFAECRVRPVAEEVTIMSPIGGHANPGADAADLAQLREEVLREAHAVAQPWIDSLRQWSDALHRQVDTAVEVRMASLGAEIRTLAERLDATERGQSAWRRGIDAVLGRKPGGR